VRLINVHQEEFVVGMQRVSELTDETFDDSTFMDSEKTIQHTDTNIDD